MSDHMIPLNFRNILNWIFEERKNHESIFGISSAKFYSAVNNKQVKLFNEEIETPIGPAAGPHTQLTQNIITAYLTGGRFFELKTVQKLDELVLDKPCIDAEDEGYNIEWSQELKIDQAYDEYLKAWVILHLLKKTLNLSSSESRGFIFNMSIGYDLAGIKTDRMNRFIDELKDASANPFFTHYIDQAVNFISDNAYTYGISNKEEVIAYIKNISPNISNSVTLSTMHGCPPNEIESIAGYLLKEKKLNTYVKLNPTLLGFDMVSSILNRLGYRYIELDPVSFDHDLKYKDAVPMLKRLMHIAEENNLQFGIKLSNTLGVNNTREKLAGQQMYMSGRSLYPLTINLATKIADEFKGKVNISFSGGASVNNVNDILSTGIYPVTIATGLLKPGGYTRFKQMAEITELNKFNLPAVQIDLVKLKSIAEEALLNTEYHKDKRDPKTMKTWDMLPVFDCYSAPCTDICPIHQDVPQYIKLIEEGNYNEAFNVITSANPLPNITGYICDHQCQFKCTRRDYDDPVMIRELKKVAAEKGYDNYAANYKSSVNKSSVRCAIIGAGPAGLSAGYFLSKAGLDVTIYDRSEYAGGTVRNVIPGFRLPQSAIEKDIEFIKLHGVKFSLNYKDDLSVESLKKQGYKYIFIAIGAGKSGGYSIPGAELIIYNGIDFLWRFRNNNRIVTGKNIAVIGGGNSAMDSARAAMRTEGTEKVYIIYRRTKEFMPADMEEFDAAIEDGVIYKELLLPSEYKNGKLICHKMKLTDKDDKGRRNVVPVEGAFDEIEIDMIISATGETVDTDFLKKNNIPLTDRNKPDYNFETNETGNNNVFIGGDALRGPSTVVESLADGKKAAEAIIARERINITPSDNTYANKEARTALVQSRKGIIISAAVNNMKSEAERCIGCDLICNKCVEVCPNRANMFLLTGTTVGFKDKFQILHLNALCNECGNCETFCPHSGAPYKDKFTLYETLEEFNSGNNNGFVLYKDNGLKMKMRIHNYEDSFEVNESDMSFQYHEELQDIEGFSESIEMIRTVIDKYNFVIPEPEVI